MASAGTFLKGIFRNRSALFALLCVMTAVFIGLALTGKMSPLTDADSTGYISLSKKTFNEIAISQRTLGYPLLLKGIAVVDPNFKILPMLQFGGHCIAVLFLYWGLRKYGFRSLFAVAGALGAFATDILMWRSYPFLLTDSLGRSLMLVTIAGCLALAADKKPFWPLTFSAVALFLAYQVRPAYLFLVAAAPAIVFFLIAARPDKNKTLRKMMGTTSALALVALLPFLLFCTVRWFTVGQFNLVSFGGYNIIGIASELITPEIGNTPGTAQWKVFFSEVLNKRKQLGLRPGLTSTGLDYAAFCDNFNSNVHIIAVPTMQQLIGPDVPSINNQLSEVSKAIILAQPYTYFRFVAVNFLAGIFSSGCSYNIPLLFSLMLFAVLFSVRTALKSDCTRQDRSCLWDDKQKQLKNGLVIAAGILLVSKTLLVSLVEPTLIRYIQPAAILCVVVLCIAASAEAVTVIDMLCTPKHKD